MFEINLLVSYLILSYFMKLICLMKYEGIIFELVLIKSHASHTKDAHYYNHLYSHRTK